METATQHPREVLARPFIVASLLLLLALGLGLRIRHLGDLGFIVDEGIQALAVRGILDHGLPRFETGLMYGRNLGISYSQAVVARILGLDEFSLRLPGVLFGVGTILISYLLAKEAFDRRVGLLAATMMTFSAWAIEFTRYGRFYAPFQCMFLLTLYCFYRGFLRGQPSFKVWFLVAFALTLPTHEMSALVLPCFLVPLLWSGLETRKKMHVVAWGASAAALWVLYRRLSWSLALSGAGETLLPAVAPAATPLLQTRWMLSIPYLNRLPLGPFEELLRQQPAVALILGLAPLLATLSLGRRWMTVRHGWRIAWLIAMVWAAFFHQFGAVALLFIAYAVVHVTRARQLLDPAIVVTCGSVGVSLAFWTWRLATDPETAGTATVKLLFGFPDVYSYFLRWLVFGWPAMAVALAVGSALLFFRFLADKSDPAPLFVLGGLWGPALAAGLFVTPWAEARYAFHLYPLVVLVFSVVVVEVGKLLLRLVPDAIPWARWAAGAGLLVGALWISQDAWPPRAWSIGSRTYRTPRDPIRAVINWPAYADYHQDCKSPALHVRDQRLARDRVLVLAPPHTLQVYAFYVGEVDFVVGRSDDSSFYRRSGATTLVERATGAEVLPDLDAVRQLIESSPEASIWLLTDLELLRDDNPWYPREVREYFESLGLREQLVGRDGRTFAARLVPGVTEKSSAASGLSCRQPSPFRSVATRG